MIVIGLMPHMCISSTARDAVPLGYSVIIPEDATVTRDLDDGKGCLSGKRRGGESLQEPTRGTALSTRVSRPIAT